MGTTVFALVLCFTSSSFGTRSLPLCENLESGKAVCSKVNDYDHLQVPSLPTNIKIEISPNGIQEIDEKKQTITFQAGISMSWVDDRLSLAGLAENETYFLRMNHLKNMLWVPDLHFPNAVHLQKAEGFKGKHLQILYFNAVNGRQFIQFADTFVVTVECKMSFSSFPFDNQECEWLMRTIDLVSSQVVLQQPILYIPDGYDLIQAKDNEPLKIDSSGLAFDIAARSLGPVISRFLYDTEFSTARIKFYLHRKQEELNKLLISYYFPSGAFAALSLFSFSIHPEVVSCFTIQSKHVFDGLFFRFQVEWVCW